MLDVYDILLGGAAPMAVAVAAFGVGWVATRRAAVAWSGGAALGYAVGVVALAARGAGFAPAVQRLVSPTAAHEWTPLVGLVAIAPSVAWLLPAKWQSARWIAAALVSAAAPLWLLWGGKYLPSQELRASGFATSAWSGLQAVMILGGVAAMLLVAWLIWDLVEREATRSRSLLSVFALVGAAATAGLTGSFVYAQLFGILAAALGGCTVAAWTLRTKAGPEAAAGPVIAVAGCLLLLAAGYSELSWLMAIGVGVAIALSAGWIPGLRRLSERQQLATRMLLCLLPLAIVLWQAGVEFAESQRQQQEEAELNPYLNQSVSKSMKANSPPSH
jgi:hypothetical protein